jgi:hypothetical protein
MTTKDIAIIIVSILALEAVYVGAYALGEPRVTWLVGLFGGGHDT